MILYVLQICQSSAFVVTGNLGSSLVVAGTPFLLETLWKEEGYAKWTTKKAELRESIDSMVIELISTPKYEDTKSRFRKEIEKYEHRTNSEDEIDDEVESSSFDDEESDQGVFIMELPELSLFFDVVLKDLRRVLSTIQLSPEDSERAESEKLEIEDLVNRAQKLIKENEDLTPAKPKLNFFRPMKDRYKGTRKDE